MDRFWELEDAAEAADKALHDALKYRVAVGNEMAVEALANLVNWAPECGYPDHLGLAYASAYSEDERKEERERLNDCPLVSEAYTYELWGKEDARTFLVLVNNIARALGLSSAGELRRRE